MCVCAQIRETRQAMRDSESGVERLAIGHHIRDRGHVMERSRNRRTGDHEERQDYINLEESECTEIRRFILRNHGLWSFIQNVGPVAGTTKLKGTVCFIPNDRRLPVGKER